MARGNLRAATQNAYRGAAGTTRQAHVHVTLPTGEIASLQVYTAIDVAADPELGQRLLSEDPQRALNAVPVPVVYHDPANELMVLVLAESDRHRELTERARLLTEMASDPGTAVPRYAREFQVVFGASGLRTFLEEKAEKAVELERQKSAAERLRADLAAQAAEAERTRAELERKVQELEARVKQLQDAPRPRAKTAREEEVKTGPFELGDDIATGNQPALSAHDEKTEIGGTFELPAGSDPLSTNTQDVSLAEGWPEGFAAFAAGNATSMFAIDDGGVRLAVRASAGVAPHLARGPLDVRLQLHRTPHYPVIAVTVATPGALRGVHESHRIIAVLDIAADIDRKVLSALAKKFAITVDLLSDSRRVRRAVLTAPLEENAAYVARAAQDHLRTLSADAGAHGQPSMSRARQLLADPGYDVLGSQHPEAGEFRDDKLGQLATANQVRRALAIARRFTRPSREDYLVTTRGYPLARWHERRRGVLARAVEWGLWMGTELAHTAVSEGLARSRKDLVHRLDAGFATMLADAAANDLDADAAEDNRKALDEEARALNVTLGRPLTSDGLPATASGTIERSLSPRAETRVRTHEELVALLDDRQQRVAAALELCERSEPRAIRPVLNSVRRMSRTEAVRVLGAAVKFGEAAAPALTAGLGSSKAYLRHGCALALGMLRTEAGTEAVIDLMLSEPTEIWRELARAVGQIGPTALMPLAARTGRLGDRASPQQRERVAWAMAHIGVRGGRGAVETLAAGSSAVAPVAAQALDLMAPAARDDLRGTGPGREVTVNRAFSRRFFEALGQGGLRAAANAELEALDASSPMELLDEADLIDVDGDQADDEELDESDLIDA